MGLLAPCLALLPFLTLCRPAIFDLASLERRSTVSGSLPTFVVSQTNKSLVANLAQDQTVGAHLEEFEYNIPNTSRYVSIVIDRSEPLDPVSFHMVILDALSQLHLHIAIHGDGPIWPLDNPYQVVWHRCNSTTEVNRKLDGTPWLTYGILRETFIGLRVILDNKGRYFLASYSIADSNQRIYGQGTMDEVNSARGAAAISRKTEK